LKKPNKSNEENYASNCDHDETVSQEYPHQEIMKVVVDQ